MSWLRLWNTTTDFTTRLSRHAHSLSDDPWQRRSSSVYPFSVRPPRPLRPSRPRPQLRPPHHERRTQPAQRVLEHLGIHHLGNIVDDAPLRIPASFIVHLN